MSTAVEGTPGLTVVDVQFEKARRATHVGMAAWATTGPPHATCRQCQHWHGCGRESGRYASHGLRGGLLKPRPCRCWRLDERQGWSRRSTRRGGLQVL